VDRLMPAAIIRVNGILQLAAAQLRLSMNWTQSLWAAQLATRRPAAVFPMTISFEAITKFFTQIITATNRLPQSLRPASPS
jgi:hypothetical protein